MSDSPDRRTLRALGVMVRLREVEERDALRGTHRSRDDYESARARLEELRRRRQEALNELGAPGASREGAGPAGVFLVRQRAFIDRLRRLERVGEAELECRRAEMTSRRERFQAARSRRKVSETLRDRRSGELEARDVLIAETSGEARSHGPVDGSRWLEAPGR